MEIDLEENDTWEIIDSDVEDSLSDSIPKFALKERDAIALLNQIPFGDIFRQVTYLFNYFLLTFRAVCKFCIIVFADRCKFIRLKTCSFY